MKSQTNRRCKARLSCGCTKSWERFRTSLPARTRDGFARFAVGDLVPDSKIGP